MCRSRGVRTCNSIRRQYPGTDGPRLEIRGWEQDRKGRVLKHMSSIFKLDDPRQVYRIESLHTGAIFWGCLIHILELFSNAVFEALRASTVRSPELLFIY
jgi:hypothetical protein